MILFLGFITCIITIDLVIVTWRLYRVESELDYVNQRLHEMIQVCKGASDATPVQTKPAPQICPYTGPDSKPGPGE